MEPCLQSSPCPLKQEVERPRGEGFSPQINQTLTNDLYNVSKHGGVSAGLLT